MFEISAGEVVLIVLFSINYTIVALCALFIETTDPSQGIAAPDYSRYEKDMEKSEVVRRMAYKHIASAPEVGIKLYDLKEFLAHFDYFSLELSHTELGKYKSALCDFADEERRTKAKERGDISYDGKPVIDWTEVLDSPDCRCYPILHKWWSFHSANEDVSDQLAEELFEALQPDMSSHITAAMWEAPDAQSKMEAAGPCPDYMDLIHFVAWREYGSPFERGGVLRELERKDAAWKAARDCMHKEKEDFESQFEFGMYCKDCKKWFKGARRWHCRKGCNKCSAEFDHHCPYLNQCVSGFNYKYFFTLLCCFELMMMVGMATCLYVLYEVRQGEFVVGIIYTIALLPAPTYSYTRYQAASDEKNDKHYNPQMAKIYLAGGVVAELLIVIVISVLAATGAMQDWIDSVTSSSPTHLRMNVLKYWKEWAFCTLASFFLIICMGSAYLIGVLWKFHFDIVMNRVKTGKFTSTLTVHDWPTFDEQAQLDVKAIFAKYVSWDLLQDHVGPLKKRAVAQWKLTMDIELKEKARIRNVRKIQSKHNFADVLIPRPPEYAPDRLMRISKGGSSLEDAQCLSRSNSTLSASMGTGGEGEPPAAVPEGRLQRSSTHLHKTTIDPLRGPSVVGVRDGDAPQIHIGQGKVV